MNDTTAFAMAFLGSPAVDQNTAHETHIKAEADTQPWLYGEHTPADAYPSLHGLTAGAVAPYQLSNAGTGFQLHLGAARATTAAVRPPPLNLEHSHTQRLNALAAGPVTPCTPYLPFSNLTLQTAALPTVSSSPLSQPFSDYSAFSSVVSPDSVVSTTLSSPTSYGNTSTDVAALDTDNLCPPLSSTLSPQLSVPTAELTVTDLGLAPEDKSLPDDLIDICKVEPDADLDDQRVGPVVVNTVPSAPSVPLTSSTSSSPNPPVAPTMPSTPVMPSGRSFYPSPPHPLLSHHQRRDEMRVPPPSLHPPPNPKPKGLQKFKYVLKPPRAVSPDDLSCLEVPDHIRNAYGPRRRQWSVAGAAPSAPGPAAPRRRASTPDDPTPPASPPAPFLRRRPSEPEEVEGEDELLSPSPTPMRKPSCSRSRSPELRAASTPELRSVSSFSDFSPNRIKRKAQALDDGQRQRPRTGAKRMSQNRNAQKKYRDKNRRLAELRAEFNITALVLVEKVGRGEISEKRAFSQLAGHSRVFKHHMKNTCGMTFERLMTSVEEALNDER